MTRRAQPSPDIEGITWHAAPITLASGVAELGMLPSLPSLRELIDDLRPARFSPTVGSRIHGIEQQVYAHLIPACGDRSMMSPRHFLSPHSVPVGERARGWHRDHDGDGKSMVCCIIADKTTTPGTVFANGFREVTSHPNRLYWIAHETVHRSPTSTVPRLLLRWDIHDCITAGIFSDRRHEAMTGD